MRQSQEAEIKGERDSQDRLRKAGQDWSKACANNPMPKIAYVARCPSIPITDTIPASQGTVRGTQLSKTHGQPGVPEGKNRSIMEAGSRCSCRVSGKAGSCPGFGGRKLMLPCAAPALYSSLCLGYCFRPIFGFLTSTALLIYERGGFFAPRVP